MHTVDRKHVAIVQIEKTDETSLEVVVCCVRCVLHGFSGLQLFFIFHLILLRFQQKLRGSEVCVKQNHFAQGSCSIPGSTTWWSRPFY